MGQIQSLYFLTLTPPGKVSSKTQVFQGKTFATEMSWMLSIDPVSKLSDWAVPHSLTKKNK